MTIRQRRIQNLTPDQIKRQKNSNGSRRFYLSIQEVNARKELIS